MLTVRELLQGLDVRLLTGEAAVDLPVRWVHISELQNPTPWLSGGELLLSTGMLLESDEQHREFVARLADHQLAGLGFGVGFRHERVPDALLAAAAERDFPVFEVPYEVPFIAVTEAAFTKLVNEQYAVLRRAIAAHERLERIVLSERGLEALAATLSTLIGAAVLVFDARGEPLVQRAFRRAVEPDLVSSLHEELCERARRREARAFLPTLDEQADRALALPVAADGAPGNGDGAVERIPEAWLVAIKDGGPLTDFDRLTLHQAVTIVALELLRGRVAGDTERRLAGDVLAAIVGGELTGGELARRLEPFGLSDRVAALVVLRPNDGRGSPGPVEDALVDRAARGGGAGRSWRRSEALDLRARRRGSPRTSCSGSRSGSRGGCTKALGPGLRVGRRAPGRRRGGAAKLPRGPLRGRGPRARSGGQRAERIGSRGRRRPAGHLQGPRLLPATAVAAGRRGAQTVL